MTVSAWTKKATKLRDTCQNEVDGKNGSHTLSGNQENTMQAIQIGIGSGHGTSGKLRYKQALESLDKMIGWVEAGQKTPPLTKG